MATRQKHRRVLRALVAALAGGAIGLSAVPAAAHNTWFGGYRKWPWKASTDVRLSTVPGECPHCSGQESRSAWLAIDAEMYFATVYSIAAGTVDGVDATGSSGAGKYVRVLDGDGTYVTYEHLSSISVSRGQMLVAGQPLGVSGDSGNTHGAHLHFQRQDGRSFDSNALSLVPISGHGSSSDPLSHVTYTSDNAGIGYYPTGASHSAFATTWRAYGGYDFGVSADLGDLWSPCREDATYGTWWRYACSPVSGTGGSVQTYLHGSQPRAIMVANGTTTGFAVTGGVLGAYTEPHAGHDWVYWIGYPTSNRYRYSSTAMQQDFQRGTVYIYPDTCFEAVYIGTTFSDYYGFCD